MIVSRLSLRAGGRGFPPATMNIEPKEIPSRLIPHLRVVFTQQFEILVTTLDSNNN